MNVLGGKAVQEGLNGNKWHNAKVLKMRKKIVMSVEVESDES